MRLIDSFESNAFPRWEFGCPHFAARITHFPARTKTQSSKTPWILRQFNGNEALSTIGTENAH
jgi:hypothetical protein